MSDDSLLAKNMREVRQMYEHGTNIMQLLRQSDSGDTNCIDAIQVSYDLQAGSYVSLLNNPEHAEYVRNYTGALAGVLDRLRPVSVMEAGTGEATTLVNVLRQMTTSPVQALGVDLSWSRIAVARRYAHDNGVEATLVVGELSHMPARTSSIDVVFTSHSVEPNRGRERAILQELFRVARRYVVLLEPSSELGNAATKARIKEHRYCCDLVRHATDLGFKIVEHRLFDYISNPSNQTALIVIAKEDSLPACVGNPLGCSICHGPLHLHKGNYFCSDCLVVYPVIGDVPCLSVKHAIVAVLYAELA
jgi:ubiquinone/menaquinone biosynthesis C-methylase UbiE